ncbi:hypothetical protein QBC46DRAFT_451721 [Diplogelasinospora grovesii]|uniref:Zn(2)-C6 fungal-type domain-containing protein n=1 Tax=Diplogelasinospora grovesii TaxID=303347 RepID=A0AAN6N3W7_9PEZI|nr:hypothetical protein QBC46DRAFT_451721 [Diplogelasinospora grovesii]
MRRQNRSCDQCRKSKRACDAPSSGEIQRSSTGDPYSVEHGPSKASHVGSRTQSCSYCLKTKKNCTFYWVQSQLQPGSSTSRSVRGVNRPKSLRPGQGQHTELPTRPLTTEGFDPNTAPLLHLLPESPEDNDLWCWDPVVPDFDGSVLSGSSFDALSQTIGTESGISRAGFSEEPVNNIIDDPSYFPGTNLHSIAFPTSQHGPQENGFNDLCNPSWDMLHADSAALSSIYSSQSDSGERSEVSPQFGTHRLSHHWPQAPATPRTSLSPFSAEQLMMDRANNYVISENLLRIYHDVLEHSLSCWLTEETCPYKIRRRDGNIARRLAITPPVTATAGASPEPTQQEFGPTWTNRIYRRVLKLDQVAQAAKLIQPTRAEDRAASKALHLVIMAFATQWAQRSQRAEERYRPPGSVFDVIGEAGNGDGGLAEEFDRRLQRSFWEQARKALQDCADLETFKVVCAEVIFGWTQKPWEDDDDVAVESHFGIPSHINVDDAGGIRRSLLSQLEDIISKDGPPVFLERAARKMRALKFKFDAHEVGLGGANRGCINARGVQAADALEPEDRRTVGLLYWLTVMADTVSSSMNERPVVLADEDCQHDDSNEAESGECADGKGNELHSQRWGVDLFIQDDPRCPLQSVRWPCSYETAARAVVRSGPVKVLLYRHVSYLQTSLRGRSRGQAIEDIIRSAMLVYRYWNVTYGAFFRDLVKDYYSVPPRIRGWFVCIHAHWHLAALMLADLIEFIDENDLGISCASRARASANMVGRIRTASANELADLSRVSTPALVEESGDGLTPQLPDFHFAVNAGTIMTEPWTIILIRAYAKAYVLHFSKVDELWRHDKAMLGRKSEGCQESLRRCEECIRALWFLGKKSDMARKVAKALTQALRTLEACISKDI